MHDATKCLMGATRSSSKNVSDHPADPGTFLAGLAVRAKSDGGLSVTKSEGVWLGISLGKSLSDHKKTSVARDGLRVPVLLEATPATQVFTITSYANLVDSGDDTLKIGATTFTFKASPSGENQVGAVTNNNTTAANLASKINAHSVAGLLFNAVAVNAVVTVTAKNNATVGSTIDAVYTDSGTDTIGLTVASDAVAFVGGGTATNFVAIGSKVYFSDTTGKADAAASEATVSDAIYVSGVLTGIDESGAEVAAALVDFPGGL